MKLALALGLALTSLPASASAQAGQPATQLTNSLAGIFSASFVDVDVDGDQDILLGTGEAFPIIWLENQGAGQFSPPNKAMVVSSTASPAADLVRAVDLDGDGRLDLVAILSSQVFWFKGSGLGQFGAKVKIASAAGVVESVSGIEIVDYDGDGDLDVLSSWLTLQGNFVGWSEALGGGVFAPLKKTIVPVTIQFDPYGLDSADFDGDGDPDTLVAGNYLTNAFWVENLGGGQSGAIHVLSSGPSGAVGSTAVEAADYDADGDVDIVSGSGLELWVYDNSGSGTFASPHVLQTISEINSISAADLDGDGDQDLLAATGNIFPLPGVVAEFVMFETLGTGLFGPKLTISSNFQAGLILEPGDMDGDGDLDLVEVARSFTPGYPLSIQENLGAGLFGPETVLTDSTVGFRNLAVGDLDQDGDLEIVSASREDDKIAQFQNLGGGAYAKQVTLVSPPNYLRQMVLADLDGDQILDILFASTKLAAGKNGNVGWYKGLGGATFSAQNKISTFIKDPVVLTTDDIDGDGDEDVLVGLGNSTSAKRVVWFQNLGAGNFANASPIVLTGKAIRSLSVADLDGDGDRDVLGAAVAASKGDVFWVENLGSGLFGPEQIIKSGSNFSVFDVRAGDVDGDGVQDVLWSIFPGVSIRWAKNLGGGVFGPAQMALAPLYGEIDTFILHDFDIDGKLDLVLGAHGAITTYFGSGNGNFSNASKLELSLSGGLPRSLVPFDIDGDGDQDIVFGSDYHASVNYAVNPSFPDCNANGVHDGLDVKTGTSADCNGNGVPDECDLLDPLLDIDGDGLLDTCSPPPLMANTYHVSLADGGTQVFSLHAPFPGSLYFLLGSLSGTSPGIQISGFTLPLNLDAYFTSTLTSPNMPPLGGTFGILASTPSGGEASATVSLSPAASPSLLGLVASHAYVVLDPLTGSVTFASNAVKLTIVP